MLEFGDIFITKMIKTKRLFLTTVFLLVVVFVIGMLAGKWLGNNNADEISEFIKNNELNTESYLIEQELIENFEEADCSLANARISSLSNELWEIGKSLSPEDAEEKLGEQNYNFMKRNFHLMQIRTYILFYKLNQYCDSANSVVLFYFNRNDKDSEEQGRILDSLVANYDIQVFAVEYNYSKELSFVEEYYGVVNTPFLIIDYDSKMEGLTTYDQIKAVIKK